MSSNTLTEGVKITLVSLYSGINGAGAGMFFAYFGRNVFQISSAAAIASGPVLGGATCLVSNLAIYYFQNLAESDDSESEQEFSSKAYKYTAIATSAAFLATQVFFSTIPFIPALVVTGLALVSATVIPAAVAEFNED
ncbi:MAG: hypothetical protein Tsb0021_02220 [Chlamydiales bacterium]